MHNRRKAVSVEENASGSRVWNNYFNYWRCRADCHSNQSPNCFPFITNASRNRHSGVSTAAPPNSFRRVCSCENIVFHAIIAQRTVASRAHTHTYALTPCKKLVSIMCFHKLFM